MNSLASVVHSVDLLPLRMGCWKPSVTEKGRLGFETSSLGYGPLALSRVLLQAVSQSLVLEHLVPS